MGVEALVATLVSVAAVIGGFFGGKRSGRSQSLQDEASQMATIQAAMSGLKVYMTELEKQLKAKDTLIADLYGRVQILESLVTQKADVDAVKEEVKGVRMVVDRIERAVTSA